MPIKTLRKERQLQHYARDSTQASKLCKPVRLGNSASETFKISPSHSRGPGMIGARARLTARRFSSLLHISHSSAIGISLLTLQNQGCILYFFDLYQLHSQFKLQIKANKMETNNLFPVVFKVYYNSGSLNLSCTRWRLPQFWDYLYKSAPRDDLFGTSHEI